MCLVYELMSSLHLCHKLEVRVSFCKYGLITISIESNFHHLSVVVGIYCVKPWNISVLLINYNCVILLNCNQGLIKRVKKITSKS